MLPVRVGTASWMDKSLVDSKLYYPPVCKTTEERLRFYAAEFPLVEVDTSYYAIPEPRVSVQWAERTPEGFIFDVKAFRLFTGHGTEARVLPLDLRGDVPAALAAKPTFYYQDLPERLRDALWRRFIDSLAPLDAAGKLGVVVFQFPPWFMPNRQNREHIKECRSRLSKLRVAVEFRNRYWLSASEDVEGTLGLLRSQEICSIVVDEPQGFESSVPALPVVTGPIAVVRFHGRNAETWQKKGLPSASERFDYYYPESELREWAPRIQAMAEEAEEVHVIMNTNRADQGIVNARAMASFLGAGLWDHPRGQTGLSLPP